MNFKYAIFDLDGTLLDTQKFWDYHERKTLEKYFGIDMFNDEDGVYIPFTGLKDMYAKAISRSGKDTAPDIRQLYKEIYEIMTDVYRHGKIEAMPKAAEFLMELKNQGVATALATATPIYMCKPALDRLSLTGYLDVLVCVDDVGKNKYHPDVFDKALERICGNKEDCMVFEDSLYAAGTLKANGYRYTIIEHEGNIPTREELRDGCENYITSYKELL